MATDPGQLRIGEFARRVGVTPELLRAWESRYGLTRPVRSPGGFRLYTAADAARVERMRRGLDEGLSAAEAAHAALEDERPSEGLLEDAAARLLAAIGRYDEAAATRCSTRALRRSAWSRSLSQVVLPTLKQVGDGWERGEIEISHEHFASNLIRGRLLALARFWGRGTGPLALLACAPGEMHDITLLAFALVLRSHSWRILFLGADTPIATLAQAAETTRPALVVVSSFDPSLLEAQAAALRRLARAVPLALAGPGATDELCARARRPPPGRRSRSGSRRGCAGMSSVSGPQRPPILLTGATGYVGGRLLRALEERGERVRCLTRRPEAVAAAPRHDDDRRRRRPRHRVPAAGDARRRDRLLPRPFDDLGGELRAAGSSRRRQLRGRGARGRRAPDRLPRWARRRRRSLEPPVESPGSRPHSRRLGCADDRVPGFDRDRLGQPLLRDASQAGRAPAGDDHAALGAHQGTADRDRGRARLPRRGSRRRARRQRGVRDRRRRPGLLRGADARVRPAARHPPLDHPGAVPHRAAVEPLARARDPRLRPRRSQADRQPSARDRRPTARTPRAPSRSGLAATGRRSRGPSRTRTASSRKPAGPTPSPPRAYGRSATAAYGTASAWSTLARSGCRSPRRRRFVRSAGSAARRAGTSATASGGCAASSTCSPAASACAAAGAIPRRRPWDRRSTSGASRPTSLTVCSGSAPR